LATHKFLSDEEIADQVYKDYLWSRDFRQERIDDWKAFYSLYKNHVDQTTYPFDANLAIPTAFSVIEVQTPFIIDMVLESGKFLEVLGRTPKGQFSAPAIEGLLDYHFRFSFKIFPDLAKFIRQLLVLGTSVYKVLWEYRKGIKTRPIPIFRDDGELEKYEMREQEEILKNNPTGYVVDLYSFGVDPNASDIDTARFAFEEKWVDPVDLMAMQQEGFYKNVEKVAGEPAQNTNEGLTDRFGEIQIEAFQNAPEVERGKVHTIDYWGYLTKGWRNGKLSTKAKSQLYHVVLAMAGSVTGSQGRPTVLLAEPSPFIHNKLPFVDAAIHRNVGEFYGMGDIEYCESLFHEQRDMRNMKLDNMNRIMNKMFVVRKGAQISESQLIWRPAGTIECEDVNNDINVLDTGIIDPAVFQSEIEIKRDIETTTGVTDFVTGSYSSATGFNDTATGISLIQQVALKRLGHKGQIVQEALKDIGHMAFSLIAQYQPYDQTVRILDAESVTRYRFLDVSEEAIRNEYDFQIVSSAALGTKEMRQQQLIQLLQILIPLEQRGGLKLDLNRYSRRLLDEMGIRNPSEFFGYQDFNQDLPPSLGTPSQPEQMMPPEEENRIMIELHQMVQPKIEEHHQMHMVAHMQAYDAIGDSDQEASTLLANHYNIHQKLAEESRKIIAVGSEINMAQQTQGRAAEIMNLLQGGTTRSPTAGGGRENTVRGRANFMAGNA